MIASAPIRLKVISEKCMLGCADKAHTGKIAIVGVRVIVMAIGIVICIRIGIVVIVVVIVVVVIVIVIVIVRVLALRRSEGLTLEMSAPSFYLTVV